MPITYRIDAGQGVIFTTASGVLTDDELLEHKRRLVEDPAFQPGMRELSDVRGVERLEVTTEGVRIMVAQDATDAPRLQDHKLAIVASEDFVYGMARMYQARTASDLPGVRVFREMDEALRWLGIGEPE